MPLREPEPASPLSILVLIGIPSLVLAVLCSVLVHQYAHDFSRARYCPSETASASEPAGPVNAEARTPDCPVASLFAIGATLVVAFCAFGLLLRSPRNVFFASLAFVNATMRLPEALASFTDRLLGRASPLISDEDIVLTFFHFKDPAGYLVILCFYIIALFFFAVIIVHDTQTIPWKWSWAILLFVSLPPLERWLWAIVRPLLI